MVNLMSVTFLLSGSSGSGAIGFPAVSGGIVRGVFILDGGNGYVTSPNIVFTGTGISAQAVAQISGGVVVGVTMINNGSGYQDTVQAAITIRASNVRLSLGTHRLSLDGVGFYHNILQSQVPFVCGIVIDDLLPTSPDINAVGIDTVHIDGNEAVIEGFSMVVICARAHVRDLRMYNFSVINCGQLAAQNTRPFRNDYFPNGNPGNSNQYIGSVPFGVGGINIGETDMLGMGTDFFYQLRPR